MNVLLKPVRMVSLSLLFLFFSAAPIRAETLNLESPLPVDPSVKVVKLSNGFTAWIKSHKRPPGKVGLWLHVDSGSMNETDQQRGLAHFLEHLAFNGTKNFPPGTLVKFFESIGMRFGQHQNAFTGFDQTTYTLQLPNTKAETLDKGLLCLSDYARQMLLVPEEINKERKVVLEELRARKGVGQRMFDKVLPVLLPGSLVPERLPIGKEKTLNAANRKRILTYYRKWYRPDNATLLVVGDLPSAAIEKLLPKHFGDWRAEGKLPADADPQIQPYSKTRAAVVTDPEKADGEVSAVSIRPMTFRKTVQDFRNELIDDLGNWIFNRRMSDLVQQGKAPFQSAAASKTTFLNVSTYIDAEATGQPEKVNEMLLSLLVELKRARQHGFLKQELKDAFKATLASAEQSARTETTQPGHAFLGRFNRALSEKRKPMSAGQRFQLLQQLLPTIKLAEVSSAFRENFNSRARLLLVTMPEKPGLKVPKESDLLALAARAEASSTPALIAKRRAQKLLAKEPSPGTIVNQSEDPDLGILSATLSNGVRVHLRQMVFRKNKVLVRITVAGGKIEETEKNRGISAAAALAFSQPASQTLTSVQIRDLMTGKNISVGGGSGDDAFRLSISGAPSDLEEGFRLAHLLLTRPKVEPSALDRWKKQLKQAIERRRTSVDEQLSDKLAALMSFRDPRAKFPSLAQVNAISLHDAQAWLEGILRNGSIEVSVVGDMPRNRMSALVRKYVGSLPKRPVKAGRLDELRKTPEQKGPLIARVEVPTITDKAVVLTGWRSADWTSVKERRTLQIAAEILTTHLREEIREKRGLTYSTACFSNPSRVYPGRSFFGAWLTADPAKAEEAARITVGVMERFAEEGPTDEEMTVVRKKYRNLIAQSQKTPRYWSGVLSDLDYHGTVLSDVKAALEKYTSYTKEDLMVAMKKYLVLNRRIQVVALPRPRKEKAAAQSSKLRLSNLFTPNMVLQREKPLPVWGWANAGEKITVAIGKNTATGTADASGKWIVKLEPMVANSTPAVMTVTDSFGKKVSVKNVLVGEVWIGSGQSNMEFRMATSEKASEFIAAAKNPALRLFYTPRKVSSRPQDKVTGRWSLCSPGTVQGFSAVLYHFGRQIQKELGVPVGLIESAWGGTRIEPWTPPEGFASEKKLAGNVKWLEQADRAWSKAKAESIERWAAWVETAKEARRTGLTIPDPPSPPLHLIQSPGHPTALYNGMIHPLVPYAIRGALWYQGESNRGAAMHYFYQMKGLIQGWRKVWSQGDFPFYFVQLAPYTYGGDPLALPKMWEAQAAALSVPHTGMAVITDIGNVKNIHPTNKREVGRRLALWALAKDYGRKNLVCSGPLFKSFKIEGSRIRVTFDHAGSGLASLDGKPLTWFSIAGKDKKFVEARAEIEGNTVVVSSPQVPEPAAVRFGWHQTAEPNFGNKEHLPTSPFRTDKW